MLNLIKLGIDMKPSMVADEMFPEGAGPYMDLDEAGGSGGLLMDLTANEKAVHSDFHNDFDDLFDDEDLSWGRGEGGQVGLRQGDGGSVDLSSALRLFPI